MNKRNKNKGILVFLILALLLLLFVWRDKVISLITPQSKAPIQNTISFPRASDKLIKGKTYALRWLGGPARTDIFLINQAAESQGVSVSIFDRVYNIENTGIYQYTVPKNIPDGSYKLEIGTLTSPYFEITSK